MPNWAPITSDKKLANLIRILGAVYELDRTNFAFSGYSLEFPSNYINFECSEPWTLLLSRTIGYLSTRAGDRSNSHQPVRLS